jgi:hypothetical protein
MLSIRINSSLLYLCQTIQLIRRLISVCYQRIVSSSERDHHFGFNYSIEYNRNILNIFYCFLVRSLEWYLRADFLEASQLFFPEHLRLINAKLRRL